MYELVDYLVKQFIDPECYEIVVVEDGDNVDIRVMADKDQVAKIIGKSGKIAKSIRTIVRAASREKDKNYSVYVEER